MGWAGVPGTTHQQSPPSPHTAFILPKAEVCVRNHVQPYIPSILEALMVPTSQGFTEVRDVFFKEVTDMNLNVINEGGIDKLGEVRPGRGSGPPEHVLCILGWAAPSQHPQRPEAKPQGKAVQSSRGKSARGKSA